MFQHHHAIRSFAADCRLRWMAVPILKKAIGRKGSDHEEQQEETTQWEKTSEKVSSKSDLDMTCHEIVVLPLLLLQHMMHFFK